MENKYFVPDIEDVRVGYECEVLSEIRTEEGELAGTEWFPYIIKNGSCTMRNGGASITLDNTIMYPPLDKARTLYLTKEQIEAEGWVATCFSESEDYGMCSFKKGAFECRRWSNQNDYIEFLNSRTSDDIIYEGGCKDINTFRYICKLLNIK